MRATAANVRECKIADREREHSTATRLARLARPASAFVALCKTCITEQHPTRLGYRIGSRMLDGEGAISANYHPDTSGSPSSMPPRRAATEPTYTHIPPSYYGTKVMICSISFLYMNPRTRMLWYTYRQMPRSFATTTSCSDHDHEPDSQELEGCWKRRRAQRGQRLVSRVASHAARPSSPSRQLVKQSVPTAATCLVRLVG